MGIVSKVKFGFVSFAVIAVVAWVGLPQLRGTMARDRSPEDFTLEVIFKPEKPRFPVGVSAWLDGFHVFTVDVPVSPWKRNLRGERGDVVKLVALQDQDGELTCTIFRASDLAIFSYKITKKNQMCEVETKG